MPGIAKQFAAKPRIAAIIALGAFLRFYRLGNYGLWIDEAFSVWMGRQPMGEMLDWLVRVDRHPPLYYLLLHLWTGLGDAEAIVRTFSALCATLTIPVVYILGRRLLDAKAGLLAALILAVSPFHVRLAQEARMYALLALTASVALYALVRLLTDPRAATVKIGQQVAAAWRTWRATRRRPRLRDIETDLAWLAYILLTAATLLTHNTAVFFPIATNLLVLGLLLCRSPVSSLKSQVSHSERNIFLRNWFLAQAGVLFLWLPWLPAFVSQCTAVCDGFWLPAPTGKTVVNTIGVFASDMLPQVPGALAGASVLFMGLAIAGMLSLRRRPARLWFLLTMLVTPIAGEWLISLRWPIFYDRTLIWASLPFYMLLAIGILSLRFEPQGCQGFFAFPSRPLRMGVLARLCGERIPAIVALLTLLALNGLSLHAYHTNFQKEQWRGAASLVAEWAQPGDLVLFNTALGQIPFDYYFAQLSDIPVVERGMPGDLFDRTALEPKMAESDLPHLRSLVAGQRRVWLVYSHNWYTDPQGLVPAELSQALELRGRWTFHGVQVQFYSR